MISDVISNINMIFIMSYSKKLATVEHCASLHVLFKNTIWNLYYKSMAPSRAPNPVHSVSGVHSPQVFWRGGEDSEKYSHGKIGIFAIYLTAGVKAR